MIRVRRARPRPHRQSSSLPTDVPRSQALRPCTGIVSDKQLIPSTAQRRDQHEKKLNVPFGPHQRANTIATEPPATHEHAEHADSTTNLSSTQSFNCKRSGLSLTRRTLQSAPAVVVIPAHHTALVSAFRVARRQPLIS